MSTITTVTIAQALISNASNLYVVDSGGNIAAALPNPALAARVHSFTLSGNATLGAAACEQLALLGAKFSLGGEKLTVRDTLAAIGSVANAGGLALAATRQVADAAYNLLNAPPASFAHVSSVVLLGAPTLNVAQYARLEALPGFTVDPSTHLTLADSVTAITGLMTAHPAWLLPVSALAVRLDGSAIGAFTATEIATLEGHGTSVSFVANGQSTTLPVTASAQDLAANAAALNHLAGQVVLHFTLTNEGTTLTAAQAVSLSGLTGFNPALHALYVVDTGAAITAAASSLFSHGYTEIIVSSGTLAGTAATLLTANLHLDAGASAELTASATVTAAQAASLMALPGFYEAGNATLSVADTISNLVAGAGGLAGIGIVQATDSETISGAAAIVLATLAQSVGAGFSLNGHTVSVTDSAVNLLNLPPASLALISGAALSANATVSAAQFEILRDSVHVALAGHVLTISDSASGLLALTGSLALAGACVLSADANVSAAQAAQLAVDPGFSTGGHVLTVSDNAANLLALAPSVQALASILDLAAPQSITVAQAAGLAALADFSAAGHALTITDTAAALAGLSGGALALAASEMVNQSATVNAAQLTALAALPGVSLAQSVVLTLQDNAANLLALPPAALALASATQLGANAQVSVAQFDDLRDDLHVALNGYTLTIADSAANLLGLSGSTSLAGETVLTASATVTAAQAASLAAEPGFTTGLYALTVADSASNLLALPNAALAIAAALTLSAGQTVSAAQLTGLAALGGVFSTSGYALTVSDNAANLLALAPAVQALASALDLAAPQSITVAQAASLAALADFSAAGHALTITDTAAALAGLSGGALALAASEIVNQSATVSAAQLTALAALPGLSLAQSVALTVQDSAANLLALPPSALALASVVQLGANAQVSVAQFDDLRDDLHVALNGYTLTIADSAANLLALSGSTALATETLLTGNATVTAAQAVALAAEPGFSTGGYALTVTGSASNLLALPNAVLAIAAALTLHAGQTVSATQLTGLAALGGVFSLGGHALTVADSATNLLALAAPALALAGTETVSQSALVSAAMLSGLAALPDASIANGVVLTVTDNAANLLALAPSAVALGGAFQLSADASVTAAQFTALRDTLHVGLNGHALTILDTAAALLGLAAGNLSLAAACVLNGNATVSASQAVLLSLEPDFSTGGHLLTITDSATNLLALPTSLQLLANELVLAASQTVTATQLASLASLGIEFSTAGHALTVADSAAALAGLSAPSLALASSEILSASATVNVAAANALAALPAFSVANGATLTVQDSAANLLSLSGAALTVAGAEKLLAGAVTLSAAQAAGLAGLAHFSTAGATITVNDTVANLIAGANAGWQNVAASVQVTDSAATLAADAPTALLQTASLVTLAGDAQISVAQAVALDSIPHFSLGSAQLTVAGTAASVAAQAQALNGVASVVEVTDSGPVSAAQADQLASLSGGGKLVFLGGSQLQVQDGYAALTADANAAGVALAARLTVFDTGANLALAAVHNWGAVNPSYVLAASSMVSAAQAGLLAGLGAYFSEGANTLTCGDTAANLLALSTQAQALLSGEIVTQSATIDAADLDTLSARVGFGVAGSAVVTVQDSAAALLGLTQAAEAAATIVELGANGAVSAAQFEQLRDAAHVALDGHVLTITDSAANLLALTGSLALAGACVLSGNATVNAAQAVTLAAEPGFSTGGHVLTITDNAAALLALAAPVQALAGALVLAAPQSVNAAQLTSLAALGGFSTGGNAITVADGAAALTGLGAPALALAGTEQLNVSSTVTAATIEALAALPNFTLANGVTIVLQDTATAILAVPGLPFSLASACQLSADATVAAAQFTSLRDDLHIGLNGHVLTVADTAANLLALAGGNLLLAGACVLDANASVSAAQLLTLAGEPAFSNGGYTLTVSDSATDLLALSPAVQALATTLALSGVQTVTAAQLTDLAALGGTFSAAGHAITVADTASALAGLSAPSVALASDEILDHSATVGLATIAALAALPALTLGNGVTLTVQDSAANLLALSPGELALASACVLSADSVATTVQATALAAEPGFSLGGHVLTIIGSAPALLGLSGGVLALAGAEIVTNSTTLNAADATALAALANVSLAGGVSLAVQDTAANLAALTGAVQALAGAYLLSANATVNVTQFETLRDTLHVALDGFVLTVSGNAADLLSLAGGDLSLAGACVLAQDATVTAAQATSLAGEPGFSTGGHALTITDSAANLLGLAAPVEALAAGLVLASPQDVSAAQLTALAALGGAFSADGHAITVADDAANLAALSAPALALASAETLAQSDAVSADIAAALAALPNFSLAEGVTLTVDDTVANLLALSAPVIAVATAYELSASGTVTAAQFETLRDSLGVALNGHAITIVDSASDLLALSGGNLSLASACLLNANATVGYTQAEALVLEPGFGTNGHVLTVADSGYNLLSLPDSVLAVAGVLELNGNQTVGADQLAGLAAFGSQFTANGYSITVNGTAAQLAALTTPELALATAEVLTQSATLSAAAAAALVAPGDVSLGNGATLTVDDTAAALLALPPGVTSVATGYELSADATVDAADFATLRDTLGVSLNGQVLTVADTAANLLALSGGSLSLAGACVLSASATVSLAQAFILAAEPGFSAGTNILTITGTSAQISASLTALQADFGGFGSHVAIDLTDMQPGITISAAAYSADSAILGSITNTAPLTIVDNAANVAAIAASLAADAHVGQITISDSAIDVVENLASLLAVNTKLAVILTDQTPLAASLVPFLVQLDQLTSSVGVSDTASQIASVVEQADASGNSAAINFLETNGVSVSGVSEVSVADLAALEQLGGNLNLNGNAIYVYDTASHLSTSAAAIALASAENDGLIAGAYVKAPGGVLTVNAATATTLFTVDGITAGYPPPQNGTIAITVSDSAANIDAHYATLEDLLLNDDVSAIVVNASATISDAILGDLQALGTVAASNVALTVRDSAATIVQHAAAQVSAQSILASAWVLSGNATVSEAQAVVLGGLPHFSAGGYTLTLSLGGNTAISVADANTLGNIASALNLNNHELLVAGTVAQLSALSAAAETLVTPELTDTLANITALAATSPLLAGTVTVSDAEAITTTQAAQFLALIANDGGPGIAIANLGFGGHTESVTGSVAQLQALTASTAWTNSVSVHGAFALTASDSVAALINGANTSYLAGLHGTTLAANAMVNAADAETLAGLESRINFSLGGHTLTVEDSAANLVALENAAGVALANSVVVNAPATLDAFDAETLLSNSHLVLNATLTIQDASANLLDGTLLSDIVNSGDAANIQVQLAGPETLDAETAASLVSLPGFDDTQHLTIADSSAYLLASGNLAAEDLAVSVTLAGDETVSANTVLRLSEVPHFTVGDNLLTLAGNDFADAATLKAIADLGTQFSDGGHTITATADALNLTPGEYTALQNDGILANGHAISAILVNDQVTDLDNIMALTATGVAGATVNVYDASGNLLSHNVEAQSGFTVTAADSGPGHAFSITETVNGTESAPVVVLEANLIETAVAAADATFATSGAIEVDSGKYLNLYLSTNVPQNLTTPALVYNATTHTISLDLPHAAAITLITLGASTHPASLDVSEILVKHHG